MTPQRRIIRKLRADADLLKAATAAFHLCRSLLAVREGATDELIEGVAEALQKAIRGAGKEVS